WWRGAVFRIASHVVAETYAADAVGLLRLLEVAAIVDRLLLGDAAGAAVAVQRLGCLTAAATGVRLHAPTGGIGRRAGLCLPGDARRPWLRTLNPAIGGGG